VSTARIRATDGVEYVVPCDEGTTLLAAAEESGHLLVSLCRHGFCGMCKAQVTAGEVRMTEHSDHAISSADEEGGKVLLCCAHAVGDAEIEVPYDSSRIGSGSLPERTVTIEALDFWPDNVVRLLVKAQDDPELGCAIPFDSGQFAELTPPDGAHARAYSFASAPNWEGTAEFYIKLLEDGYFSNHLRSQAAIGDELILRGPQGAFGLHDNGSRPRWMVCGGTGLAPLMSMLRRMADWGDTQETLLIFGVDTPADVFASAALADLKAALPSLRVAVTVVHPDDDWTGPVGTAADTLNAELESRAPTAESPDIYLCGPSKFLAAAHTSAQAHGIPVDQIYEERI